MKTILTLSLILFSSLGITSSFAKPSEASGILKLNQDHPKNNIFAVSLFAIDGKQIIKRDNAVWLKPGAHTIRVSATVNLNSRSKLSIKRQKVNNKQDNTLDIFIEDGKTYYVGYDTNDTDPNKWHPVVWKVK